MHRVATVSLALMMLAAPVAALTQQNREVEAGQRVRANAVVGPLHPITAIGTLIDLSADSLSIRSDGRDEVLRIGVRDITTLDVSVERHSRWAMGMAIGLGVGAMLGCLADLDIFSPQQQCHPSAAFFFIGGGAGALFGAAARTERWVPATLPEPSGGGYGFRFVWTLAVR